MKAIYKKTAFERILELKREADMQRKTIDYLLITPEEWYEIRSDIFACGVIVKRYYSYCNDAPSTVAFNTVALVPRGESSFYSRRFTMSQETILGLHFVVAPIEFH